MKKALALVVLTNLILLAGCSVGKEHQQKAERLEKELAAARETVQTERARADLAEQTLQKQREARKAAKTSATRVRTDSKSRTGGRNKPLDQSEGETLGGHTPQQILTLFGYKGVAAVSERQLASYQRVFGFTDADRDGRHSKKEYIENGRYMTVQSRKGIFTASDSNRDGFVSEAEYVENRCITDEAKEIFHAMDGNRDSRLTAKEFHASGKFKDETLAKAVFKALDTSGNGELVIPEYLRVWGRWARN